LASPIEPTPDPATPSAHDIAPAAARLQTEHREQTSALQHWVDRLTAVVGWPGFVAFLMLAIGAWVAANLLARSLGAKPLDPPPFVWLQGAITTSAFFVTVVILTTQRREDELASHRLQLLLELLILNDRKISKIIELLAETGRGLPVTADGIDGEVLSMATPSDTHAVVTAIKDGRPDGGQGPC
jgi:uncharacterized membrane protein